MDVEYSFGRSIDVDGDEWIDLGLPPAPLEIEDNAQHKMQNEEPKGDSKKTSVEQVMAKVIKDLPAISEPMPEPEPEQREQTEVKKKEQQKKHGKVFSTAPASKAAKSKEALMAFYLGRAKQMEAKHKKIVAAPTKPVVARTQQTSMRPTPIGL